ncbi:Hypothetical protein FORC77_2773 [Vibrio vulnificus]|nr:Hypothetical protein FORC77_2773 [Vibrio vulnificus]
MSTQEVPPLAVGFSVSLWSALLVYREIGLIPLEEGGTGFEIGQFDGFRAIVGGIAHVEHAVVIDPSVDSLGAH